MTTRPSMPRADPTRQPPSPMAAAVVPRARHPCKLAVIGLGHVGLTTAACLAAAGHSVLAVEEDERRLAQVKEGRTALVEPGLSDLLGEAARQGNLVAAGSLDQATRTLDLVALDLEALDLVAVCVGTPASPPSSLPSLRKAGLDLSQVTRAIGGLGAALARRDPGRPPLLVVLRSTLPPGATQDVVLPLLEEAAGEKAGGRFELVLNPEFLREGQAVADFLSPSRIIVGERHKGAGRRLLGIYDALEAPLHEVGYTMAETTKLVDNSFHALKVAFANEVGRLAWSLDLEPQELADLFLADPRLNLGPAYLRPGGPFGGTCLPKDLEATHEAARALGLSLPVLEAVPASNRLHLLWLVEQIRKQVPPPGPLLQLGLSFKAGTGDLRGSPLVELATHLLATGYELWVLDPDLAPGDAALPAPLEGRLLPGLEALPPAVRLVLVGKQMAIGQDDRLGSTPRLDISRLRHPG